jgi:hypothetical protein
MGFKSQQEIFSSPKKIQIGSGSRLARGYQGPFPGLKQLGCVDYWPSSSTEVKNDWSYTSVSPIGCHGMDKDSYTFFYLFAFVLVLNFFLIFKKTLSVNR